MKKNILATCCFLGVFLTAHAIDSKLKHTCNSLPVKSGTITRTLTTDKNIHTVLITGNFYDVNSLDESEVMSVFRQKDSSQVVIVETKSGPFITYLQLQDVKVHNGQKIKKGQLLAKAGPAKDGSKREIGIQIWVSVAGRSSQKELSFEETLDFLKKADN